ncbi:MAG: pyridoxamine 5'-phosphate oxidase family protein [Acidimicrobiia bacterium]
MPAPPDGRPHVIPRDGMWIDGKLYYGGSPETVHYRNIVRNPEVAVHIGYGQEAIILEGAWTNLTEDATRFVFG